MKVLFISGGKGADYMNDICFHGLRSLLGPDCVDVAKINFMYENWHEYMFHSLYRLLPDIEVDRERIQERIISRDFDGVIYGSVHRCRDYMDIVLDKYPSNKIAFIDGEDGPELAPTVGHGWYFKREIYAPNPDLIPIQFGIPKDKIRPIDFSRKTRLMSPLIPGDYSTYLYYGSEKEYYDQYSESYFAHTRKKGGWDCMRHYEIIASGCMPYFENIENCPEQTLTLLPKNALSSAKTIHEFWDADAEFDPEHRQGWGEQMQFVQERLKTHLTTEAIATRILDRLQ